MLASNLKYPGKLICIEKTEYFPYSDSILVVSDSGNNRVLIFDEETKECLDGEKGSDKQGDKDPEVQQLASPWDIVPANKNILLFAMAGIHQIWILDLSTVSISI